MGIPNSGPPAAHGGTKCAAINLSGSYPENADTRLYCLSYFPVPEAAENPRLRFWHWFSFASSDYGKVQIHIQGTPNTEWIDVSGQFVKTGSSAWTYPLIDLTAFAGKTIQIAFFFHATGLSTSTGWYIDDIEIQYDHTGIQENLIQKLNIYPNPFSEKATIQFDDTYLSGYMLTVYNISGTKVMEIKDIRSDKIELEKGALPAGIYIVELKGDRVYRNKIIIR
ncbi:MAG TPA: T9SS type A sorting domain-containing protein [Bacteroidales bacterium]|nr:T9SS type A sorting domain-containing protein [Bacteroidales bacterium]